MKFKANRDHLAVKINKLMKNVATKTALPVYATILFEIKEGNMVMTSNNGTIQMSTSMECSTDAFDAEASFCVPAAILTGTLNSLRDDLVSFNHNEGKLEIKSGKEKYRISVLEGKNFILFPSQVKEDRIVVNSSELKYALECVDNLVAGPNDPRAHLAGVSISAEQGIVRVIGASGPMAGFVEIKFLTASNWPEVIIPASLSNLVRKTIGENEETHLIASTKGIEIRCADITITSSLVAGKYPLALLNGVLEKISPHSIEIEKTLIEEACKKLGMYTNDVEPALIFDIAGENMRLHAENVDYNHSAMVDFTIPQVQLETRLGFNSDYLQQIFSKMNGDNIVKIHYCKETNLPLQITSLKVNDKIKEKYFIMPMMIKPK